MMKDRPLHEAASLMRTHHTAHLRGERFLQTLRDAILTTEDGFSVSGPSGSQGAPVSNPLPIVVLGLRIWVGSTVTPAGDARIEFGRMMLNETGRLELLREGALDIGEAERRLVHRAWTEAFLIELAAEVRTRLYHASLFDRPAGTMAGIAVTGDLRPTPQGPALRRHRASEASANGTRTPVGMPLRRSS